MLRIEEEYFKPTPSMVRSKIPELLRRSALICNSFIYDQLGAGPSGRAVAEIVGSNPTGDMDVCLLSVLCVVR